MSKIFSLIGLETNTGIRDIRIISGIPELEDIQNSQVYKELVEDCGGSAYIGVIVKSFRYGHGPPKPAKAAELSFISIHPKIIETSEVNELQTIRFAIVYPDSGNADGFVKGPL